MRPIRLATVVSLALLAAFVSPTAQASRKASGRPNNDEIAYTIDRKGPNHIYVSDLAGRHPRLLVKGRDPAWSPDGQWLSYRTGNPDRPGGNATRIHLIRPDGSSEHTLVLHVSGEASGEAGPAVWSPDGRWLLFDTLGGIYLVRTNGDDLHKVSEFPGHHLACYDLEPSWNPDGTEFVFAVLCDGGDLGLWTVDVNGTGRTRLLATGRGHPLVAASDPVWSPDGRSIAFDGVREKRGHGYVYDVYTVSADGKALTALRTGRGYAFRPAWSPDGTEISFSRYGHGVSLIQPNGTREMHVNRLPGSACCLAWNPSP